MATTTTLFGTDTAFTITMNSLANGAYRASAAVTNTSNFIDAAVMVNLTLATSGVSGTGRVHIYAYGSNDNSAFTDNVVGTNSVHTTSSNLIFVQSVVAASNSGTPKVGPFSLASVFGGILPKYFGIVVLNATATSLHSSGNTATYTGISLSTS